MYPYLVADIGGTNARFALVTGKHQSEFTLEHIQILSTQKFATFEDALSTYLESIDLTPTAACMAIAGPVDGDRVKMTNLSWEFTGRGVSDRFGFSQTLLMNDFAAVAAACPQMSESNLTVVKPGDVKDGANKAVYGPGTGLGVAGVVYTNGQWIPVPSEGGHVNIAPATPYEADVIKAAMSQLGHVSAESLVSGPGLVNLYKAVCLVENTEAKTLEPSEISQQALDGSDPICQKALDLFISFAGSFAGNIALTYGAKGGVYIAGGIIPKILSAVQSGPYIERFKSKGPMSHYVENIPVLLMTHTETAFVGAAAWLEQHL